MPTPKPHTWSNTWIDLRDYYGGEPDPTRSAAPALQMALDDAAQTRRPLYVAGGGWAFDEPAHLHGDGVRLIGHGASTRWRRLGYYSGEWLTVGLGNRAAPPAACRPRAQGVYDGSAGGDPRWGVAVSGGWIAACVANPLQLGRYRDGAACDGWAVPGWLTWDFLLDCPDDRYDSFVVAGLNTPSWGAAPYRHRYDAGGGLTTFVRTTDGERPVAIPPNGARRLRGSVALDTATGEWEAWRDGKRVAGGNVGPCALTEPSIFTPFALGAAPGSVAFAPGDVAPCTWWGYRLAAGRVYATDPDGRQVFAADPTAPVNDLTRYFISDPKLIPDPIGTLPLTDAPGKSWVRVEGSGAAGWTCLHWCPSAGGDPDTRRVVVSAMDVSGGMAAPVLIGRHLGLELDHLDVGGRCAAALGSLAAGGSWPWLRLQTCGFEGHWTAAAVAHSMSYGRQVSLKGGVESLSLLGADGSWEGVFVPRLEPWAKRVFAFTGDDNGGRFTARHVEVDDEGAQGGLEGVYVLRQGHYAPTDFDLDCAYGVISAATPWARLVRSRGAAHPHRLTLSRLLTAGNAWPDPAVVVEGEGPEWYGTVEGGLAALPAESGAPAASR